MNIQSYGLKRFQEYYEPKGDDFIFYKVSFVNMEMIRT